MTKEGSLYKERDILKGWRERQFVLQDTLLHYYLDSDRSSDPRGTMEISGCSIEATKTTTVDGVTYYPFVIKSGESSQSIHLASTSVTDTTSWVIALGKASNRTSGAPLSPPRRGSAFSSLAYTNTSVGANSNSAAPEKIAAAGESAVSTEKQPSSRDQDKQAVTFSHDGIMDREATLQGIPDVFLPIIEENIQTVISLCSNTCTGWEPLFEKNGITASKKQYGSGLCVLGDYTFSGSKYTVLDIFSVIADLTILMQFDTQRESTKKVEEYSANTWLEHIQFKQIWPLSARDTLMLVHWRQLEDGSVVVASNSFVNKDYEKAANAPLAKNTVRADILGGYHIKRTGSDKIRVKYLASLDLKGSIPVSVVNFVLKTNPMTLGRMKDFLDLHPSANPKPTSPEVKLDDLRKAVTVGTFMPLEQSQAKYSPIGCSNAASTITTAATVCASVTTPSSPASSTVIPAAQQIVAEPPTQRSKLNSVALTVWMAPSLLAYLAPGNMRPLAFIVGFAFAVRYVYHLFLQQRYHLDRSTVLEGTQPFFLNLLAAPRKQIVVQFSVDLSKLLQYVDMKREQSELEITLTHVTVKAVACALKACTSRTFGDRKPFPIFNGNLLFGKYYQARKAGVDIGVSFDLVQRGGRTVILKVVDADLKPIEYITEEVQKRHRELRNKTNAATEDNTHIKGLAMLSYVPKEVLNEIDKMISYVAVTFGLSVPALGIDGTPNGVCHIINSPNVEGEADTNVMVYPDISTANGAPVTVTFGGIKMLPFFDDADRERKLQARPVLTYSVCIDSRAGALSEGRRLCSKIQQFLNDPYLME